MKLKEVNYYGFNHEAVAKKFSGGLTYLRTFTIRGYHWAVYRAANPNRELGHKDYMMLGGQADVTDPDFKMKYHVSGCTVEDMEIERIQEAVLCLECDSVIYSINRHHFHYCACGGVFVDGGKDYVRRGGKNLGLSEVVKIDLVTGHIVERNGISLSEPIKLDSYCDENPHPDLKVKKKRAKSSHSGEKKRLTTRRKSGKVKSATPRSKK